MEELELKSTIQVCQLNELTPEEQHLLQLAIEATDRSYAPYSEFCVGAAVRLGNGIELSGCNQENAAYPSGLCAERTALFYAGAQYPDVPVRMLAIAARGTDGELTEEPTGPCGACRQVIIESETRDQTRTDMIIDYHGKQYIIEMKIWRGNSYNERGEQQLAEYLDFYNITKGYLLSFCFNKKKIPAAKTIKIGDREIVEVVV